MNFTKMMLAATVLTAAAFGVHAADAPAYKGPSLDYKTAPAGTYKLDKTHAGVTFRINHLGFSNFIGRFEDVDGTATVNPADLSKSGVIFSVETDSVDTNVDKLDDHLEAADFFDSKTFKAITFTSTKVEITGTNAEGKSIGKVHGMLSLRGVTKPVVLDVVFNGHGVSPFGGGERMGFDGTTTIKRSDFGMGAMVPMVGDEVQIQFAVEFTRA
jgi:polyisoprenoid-binding protein YceI